MYLVIMIDELCKHFPVEKDKAPATCVAMKDWLQSKLSEFPLLGWKEFKDAGVDVFCVRAEEGQTLIVPPCSCLCSCTPVGTTAVGVKKLYLPKGERHRGNFTLVSNGLSDNKSSMETVDAIIDSYSMSAASKPASA